MEQLQSKPDWFAKPVRFIPAILLTLLITTTLNAQTNYALVFGNTSDYVSIPNAAVSSITSDATFEVWVKPANNNETARIIDHITDGYNDGFLLDILSGHPRIVFGSFGVTANTVLSANTWHHIAVTSNPPYITTLTSKANVMGLHSTFYLCSALCNADF